jgi:hypothetical protein
VLLCRQTPTLTELQATLPGATPTEPGQGWDMPAPGFWMPWRGERLLVDTLPLPWPDEMTEPAVRSAWAGGWLGPQAYPGCLERSVTHNAMWPESAAAAKEHRAVVRIMLESQAEPAVEQLEEITRLATALLQLPGTLGYFNPNGETLLNRNQLLELTQFGKQKGRPPFDLWCNVRLFGAGEGWAVVDSVGMGQFGHRDHEVCFPDAIDRLAAANMVHNLQSYQVASQAKFQSGDTIDGPGGAWVVLEAGEGFRSPIRRTLRWFSQTYDPPEELLSALGQA